MKKVLLSLISTLILISCGGESKKPTGDSDYKLNPLEAAQLFKQAKQMFGAVPDTMKGTYKDTPERIELGKKLYFETLLSDNNTQSCNSCHFIDEGRPGVDNLPVSPGAHGEDGTRNSPTVFNAGFQFVQFWDGRATDLKEQAKGPIVNPVEMAMKSESDAVKVLKGIPEYADKFANAFPGESDPVTYDNLAEAIAAFERTLISRSRFDDYCNGNQDALTDKEKAGLNTFIKSGCITCHTGPLVGGNMYQKAGLVKPYENTEDLGRFEVTGEESDKFLFKVPQLRNVALTAPYFHDGNIKTLDEAIIKMADMNLGKQLTEDEVDLMKTFLNSLTGKEFEKKEM